MHRIKAVLLSTAEDWHGGEQQALLLAQGLRRHDHDCQILARRGAPFAQRLRAGGFPVTEFLGKGWNPVAQWSIRCQLRRWQPDILHFNDSHALTTGGCASWGMRRIIRVVSRRGSAPPRSAIRYRCFADRVVCVSRAVAGACAAAGIENRRLQVVYDGVDPHRVWSGNRNRGRRSLQLTAPDQVVVCVASLTEPKGHACLLTAWAQVLKNQPLAQLVLVGDGPLSRPLKRQAQALGIGHAVKFLGYREDVPDLIQAADVCTLASHLEGLGSSLIDAMLAGRPVVTSTAGGIPELLGDETAPVAWTVAPQNPIGLAAALVSALRSPEEAARRAARARRRAMQYFVAPQMIRQTIKLYDQALSQARWSGGRTRRPDRNTTATSWASGFDTP